MSTETSFPPKSSRYYHITVEGKIDPSWSEWLAGMRISSRKEADGMHITTLSGILTDQSALRGLLIRLWDLNLSLRAVQQVDPSTTLTQE